MEESLGGGKKNFIRMGAHLIFVDESGFMLIPSVRKTWAPKGKTPVIHHRYRNDRLSVISGISVSPRCFRLGLYGMFFLDNIGQEEVCLFLHEVLRHLPGTVIALLDNSNIHRGIPCCSCVSGFPGFTFDIFRPTLLSSTPKKAYWVF